MFRFLTSAVDFEGCPADATPEIALAGRSNSGKSSFLNALAGSKIARVSSEPGKTRLLNFYDSSSKYRLVDMPGYGYAKRGEDERDSWGDMIEPYLAMRGSLCGVVIIMDIRRDWALEEKQLLRWLAPLGLPAIAALTKADKLSRSASLTALAKIQRTSGVEAVFVTSALKRTGHKEIEEYTFKNWVKKPREIQ